MKVSGWGRYPDREATALLPRLASDVPELIANRTGDCLIGRGLGRSYGDSALAEFLLDSRHLDQFIEFDPVCGLITCAAGVSLDDILGVCVPRGWFLPVTPGTRYVTVAGAIASDVHGKNHHLDGCFSQHVSSLQLATVSEGVVTCSEQENTDLFRATCGGMGLTGYILQATIALRPIASAFIEERTLKTANLAETFDLFAQHHSATYSVAWIDCIASGDALGRSHLMLGEHSESGELTPHGPPSLSVPIDAPDIAMNRHLMHAFNAMYYARKLRQDSHRRVHYAPFFYPLDAIGDWNRAYGSKGFLQYQFVMPREAGLEGMTEVLQRVARSRRASFLAVLKAFGQANSNYLSFPIEGYTLALDFKRTPGLLELLDELDRVVLDYGGRFYLAKDARMSEATFKQGYPEWEKFDQVRKQYGAHLAFNSAQSKRLGL